jgi:hypothetical protein
VFTIVEFLGLCDAGGKTFALSIGGQRHTYRNDKEDKRQAILDGLNTIETVVLDRDVYLPSNQALHPEQPFYLLDDGARPVPPLFYPMLNKALAWRMLLAAAEWQQLVQEAI